VSVHVVGAGLFDDLRLRRIGIYNINPDSDLADSETKFGINAGAGFTVPVGRGSTRLFGEARFHNVFTEGESLNLLPLTVGIMFGGS